MGPKNIIFIGLLLTQFSATAEVLSRPLIVGVTAATTLRINVESNTPKCNVEISLPGNGNVEREVSPPRFEASVEFTPQQEGQLQIQWKGKTKFRGFNTVFACPGSGLVLLQVEASAEQILSKWNKAFESLPPDKADCIKTGLRVNGIQYTSTDPSAHLSRPDDESIKPIFETCDSFLQRPLKVGLECSLQGTTKTLCDEIYTVERDGQLIRLSQSEAMRAQFESATLKVAILERQEPKPEPKSLETGQIDARVNERHIDDVVQHVLQAKSDPAEEARLAKETEKRLVVEQKELVAQARRDQVEATRLAKEAQRKRLAEERETALQAKKDKAEEVRLEKEAEKRRLGEQRGLAIQEKKEAAELARVKKEESKIIVGSDGVTKWVEIGRTEIGIYYANPSSIRKAENTVLMSALLDLKRKGKTLAGYQYLSAELHDAYDCSEKRWRSLLKYYYTDNMGAGEFEYNYQPPDKWLPLTAVKMNGDLWRYACSDTSRTQSAQFDPSAATPKSYRSQVDTLKDGIGFSKVFVLSPELRELKSKVEWKSLDHLSLDTNNQSIIFQQKDPFIVIRHKGKVVRKVTEKGEVNSQLITGTRNLPNPAYQQALLAYQQAATELNQEKFRNSLNKPANIWGVLAQGVGEGIYASSLDTAQSRLSATPATISQDVTQAYSFQTSKVESEKIVSFDIFLVDPKLQSIKKFNFSDSSKKTFSLAMGIQDRDPRSTSHKGAYNSEQDIDQWERTEVSVDIEKPLKELSSKITYVSSENYRPKESLYSTFGLSKSEQSTATRDVATKRTDDPRFESVVVVSNSKGMGTGFFVAADLILTNEHVVAGSSFAEVKTYGGSTTFGKVIKTDLNRDLALIRVADKGKAVTLIDEQVSVGNTVDVIGHPRGLSYSLSRGVVSATRAMKTGPAGGKSVKYIQTDAVINAGNSGGPMYIMDKVVGVNTQKLSGKSGIEGIGFAVHIDEIRDFLRD